LLGEDQSLLEASLSVARILREIPIDSLEGLSVLALLQEVIDILKLVRARGDAENISVKSRTTNRAAGRAMSFIVLYFF